MPRAKRVPSTPARIAQDNLWAAITGAAPDYTVADWDPDAAAFLQACLEVAASGSSVFIRSGSGGRSLGIAIWEGDNRYPATWFGEHEELDEWTRRVVAAAELRRGGKPEPNGA